MKSLSQTKRLYIIAFLRGLYFYLPIFTLFFTDKGVSLESLIIAQTCYSIFSFISEIPTGVFADKFGQKKSVIIGNIIEIAGIVGLLFSPTAIGLFISYSIRGFGSSFISGADDAWTYEIAKNEGQDYKKVSARIQTIDLIGGALSAGIAGIVVQLYGSATYPWLIIATAVAIGLSLIISATLRDYVDEIHEDRPKIWSGIILPTIQILKKNVVVRALLIVLILSLNGEYFLQSIYQPIFVDRAVLPIWLGFGMAIGTLFNAVMTQGWVRLHKTYKFSTLQSACTIVLGVLFVIFASISNPIITIASYIAMMGLFNTTQPLISQYVHKEVESKIRSTVGSAISFVRTGFQIMMRLLLGTLVGVFSPLIAIGFFGAYLVIGGFVGKKVLKDCGCTD